MLEIPLFGFLASNFPTPYGRLE